MRMLSVLFLLLVCQFSSAYEREDAVPLRLNVKLNGNTADQVHVRLNGRRVEISAKLKNNTAKGQAFEFKFFKVAAKSLGEGEEHADKTFSDLRVVSEDRFQKILAFPKYRIWKSSLHPQSIEDVTIRYQALPEFALEEIDSEFLLKAVQKHCGNADGLKKQLIDVLHGDTQILLERYEIPLAELNNSPATLEITPVESHWLRARPLLSFACGLDSSERKIDRAGTVKTDNQKISILILSKIAKATDQDNRFASYNIGNTIITENKHIGLIGAASEIKFDILPGGHVWPPLTLDDRGHIFAGNKILDSRTGRKVATVDGSFAYPYDVQISPREKTYLFTKRKRACELSYEQLGIGESKSTVSAMKDSNIDFAFSEKNMVALVTQFSPEGNVSGYQVDMIDLGKCKITSRTELGNPDLLVEINYSSKGHWWITGSIEQTLLRSKDGKNWNAVKLPKELSSLISSYIVSDKEIWLAAHLANQTAADFTELVYSNDAGKTWRTLKKNDAVLKTLPPAWLEGHRRN